MSPPKKTEPNKRPASPSKPHGNSKNKAAKTLSFRNEVEMLSQSQNTSGSRSQDGGAHGHVSTNGNETLQQKHDSFMSFGPPQWFQEFETRQEVRFANVLKECREVFEGFKLEMDNMKDEITMLKQKLDLTEVKLDDLENRSRRNNIVIFNLPEGTEQDSDCCSFIGNMLKKDCNIDQVSIQRAHRTGRMKSQQPGSRPDKPRPIHVGFTFFQEKEKCRKALADLFKSKTFGPSQAKLFVANDYSQKVQQLRRDKLKELCRLKNEGKNAFFVYPATIKIREANGVVRDP